MYFHVSGLTDRFVTTQSRCTFRAGLREGQIYSESSGRVLHPLKVPASPDNSKIKVESEHGALVE